VGPTRADQVIAAIGASVGWRGRPARTATIEAHVDGSAERFVPGLVQGATPPPGASRGSAGAALDASWHPAEHVILGASGRLDAWTDTTSDGTSSGQVRPTGHLGVESALDPVTLAAHAGATARPPSFVELYGDRGAFVGDPSLLPESAWTVDAGARAARRVGPVRFSVEIVGFATWAQDLITFVPTGAYGRATATNIGRARLGGVEVDARVAAGPVELRVAYTGLATEDDASCTAAIQGCARPPLPGRPANDLVADVIGKAGPASLRLGVDAVSGMFSDVVGSVPVPARALASAGARVDVARGVRLAVDVRNVFDVRTVTYAGALGPVPEPIGDAFQYPLPGRSVLVSARFSEGPR
jgi:outer membrane receptor protein involved in Fe transport